MIAGFSTVITISAAIAIYFRQLNNHGYYSIFKPLTTILIILFSVFLNLETGTYYGWIVIVGLFFSLIGDVLLLNDKWFVYGLGSFLIAHIIFTHAFSSLFGFQYNPIVLIVLVCIGFAYFKFLQPTLKSYVVPVAFYFLAIIVMDWQALSLSFLDKGEIYYLLGISSILFSFSDAVIAYNKFKKEFKSAELLILSTYWLSIFIICISIRYIQ